ncbi:MAG: HDOD domain-containing protein [Proteobacteria bacterium]|nr:HDOD domain-containing protein [Pseudomonadota bacterium]
MEVYVARQPILDFKKNLYAYELLFRDGLTNYFPDINGDEATSRVLSSSFFTIGLEKITGKKLAFINFTKNLLHQEVPLLFPKKTTVIEILENVNPEQAIIERLKQFSKKGYTIALDDFKLRTGMKSLIEVSDIIKIDFRLTPPQHLEPLVINLKARGVKLLAEKVETMEEFQKASELGFDYFQGYFFCKPEILTARDVSSTNLNLLTIMAEVNKEDFDFDKIESVMTQDVSISYKLLRYINSAFFRVSQEITSIKQAALYLGQDELRRFVSLIAMSKIASRKPEELVRHACVKARFCEAAGKKSNTGVDPNELFMVGLFSSIDAILDQPMPVILKKLPLSKRIKLTLTGIKTEHSIYLDLIYRYEKGEWGNVRKLSSLLSIPEEEIPPIYLYACECANCLTE